MKSIYTVFNKVEARVLYRVMYRLIGYHDSDNEVRLAKVFYNVQEAVDAVIGKVFAVADRVSTEIQK